MIHTQMYNCNCTKEHSVKMTLLMHNKDYDDVWSV